MTAQIHSSTRQALHHAAQVLGMSGRIYRTPQADDSHTALDWHSATRGFTVNLGPARVALIVETAILQWSSGDNIEQYSVSGHTRADLSVKMQNWLAGSGLDSARFTLNAPYDLPPHVVLSNKPFEFDSRTL